MQNVIISVGSNINAKINIQKAEKIIDNNHKILGKSKLIKTKPVGFKNQPDFLNGAFYLETLLDLNKFKLYLKTVEKELKRIKGKIKSGPRTIDLDIIIWNKKVIEKDFYKKNYIQIPIKELIDLFNIKLE